MTISVISCSCFGTTPLFIDLAVQSHQKKSFDLIVGPVTQVLWHAKSIESMTIDKADGGEGFICDLLLLFFSHHQIPNSTCSYINEPRKLLKKETETEFSWTEMKPGYGWTYTLQCMTRD